MYSKPSKKGNTGSEHGFVFFLLFIFLLFIYLFFAFNTKNHLFILSFSKKNSDLWIDKYYYFTAECFPSIRRTSPIVQVKLVEVCPIEHALSAITDKNTEVWERYLLFCFCFALFLLLFLFLIFFFTVGGSGGHILIFSILQT